MHPFRGYGGHVGFMCGGHVGFNKLLYLSCAAADTSPVKGPDVGVKISSLEGVTVH